MTHPLTPPLVGSHTTRHGMEANADTEGEPMAGTVYRRHPLGLVALTMRNVYSVEAHSIVGRIDSAVLHVDPLRHDCDTEPHRGWDSRRGSYVAAVCLAGSVTERLRVWRIWS